MHGSRSVTTDLEHHLQSNVANSHCFYDITITQIHLFGCIKHPEAVKILPVRRQVTGSIRVNQPGHQ